MNRSLKEIRNFEERYVNGVVESIRIAVTKTSSPYRLCRIIEDARQQLALTLEQHKRAAVFQECMPDKSVEERLAQILNDPEKNALFQECLPDFKKAIAAHIDTRLGNEDSTASDVLFFFSVIEQLKNAKELELIENIDSKWIGRTVQTIADHSPDVPSSPLRRDDWASDMVIFLNCLSGYPKFVDAFVNTYKSIGTDSKGRSPSDRRTLMQNWCADKGEKCEGYESIRCDKEKITDEMRERLGLTDVHETVPLTARGEPSRWRIILRRFIKRSATA